MSQNKIIFKSTNKNPSIIFSQMINNTHFWLMINLSLKVENVYLYDLFQSLVIINSILPDIGNRASLLQMSSKWGHKKNGYTSRPGPMT